MPYKRDLGAEERKEDEAILFISQNAKDSHVNFSATLFTLEKKSRQKPSKSPSSSSLKVRWVTVNIVKNKTTTSYSIFGRFLFFQIKL